MSKFYPEILYSFVKLVPKYLLLSLLLECYSLKLHFLFVADISALYINLLLCINSHTETAKFFH